MKFEVKELKNNIKFFIIVPIIIVLISLLSIFVSINSNQSILKEEDLPKDTVEVNKIIINEIMLSNKGAYPDSNGKLYDYIEIYNGKNKEVNLKGYGLSDVANAVKWTFPDVIVEPKGYVIVFLSGTNNEYLHAPFKLKSAGGENLALRNPNGKIIDAVTTVSTLKNTVMARNDKGSWVIQNKPTPGYPNTLDGYLAFQKSLVGDKEGLLINEILPNNKGNFKDNYGKYSGYIEIINTSKKTISLKDYSLSNEEQASFKWQFPNIAIAPNEVIVVYTSNRNLYDDVLHASFKLSNQNGYAILSNSKGKIIDKVEYNNIPNGMAYIREKKGFEVGNNISPGYSNDIEGIKKFQTTIHTPKSLIISEAMNSNYKYLAQNGGRYYDWVELKNNSKEPLKLKNYYLTTNTDNMTMYNLPDVELKSEAYYVVMASGNTNLSNSSYKHANFKLGEITGLYLTDGKEIIDTLFIANVPKGYSIGKGDSSGVYYYSTPTPKAANKSGSVAVSYSPSVSTSPGVYNNVKNVSVELKGTGTIYYTLNGSTPTTSSKVYNSPISLTKSTVIKYMAHESGKIKSKVGTASYIINENHVLPVLSLSLNPSALSKLNSHPWSQGYEVGPATIELLGDGDVEFSEECALQLFGGSTRGHSKKSYEVVFKKKYGSGHLEYQVFDNRDTAYYNSLVLRTGSQDEFMGDRRTLIRDLVATSLVEEYTSVDVQAYKSVILYINGSYRGIYFIREKVDEYFVGNHYNVDGTKSDILRIDGDVKNGNRKKYNALKEYVRSHSMTNDKYYNYVVSQLNLENFVDYWIAESFVTNYDMVNCRFFSNPYIEDGKWHYVFYDLDFAMYHPDTHYFNFMTSASGINHNHYENVLIRNLMKNKNFKKYFLERLSYNLKNTWSLENYNKRVDEIAKSLEKEMPRNLKKYNNISMSEWKSQVNYLKTFAKKRHSYIKSQAKSYFHLSDSEYKKYFG
jgi:hypothetical protein